MPYIIHNKACTTTLHRSLPAISRKQDTQLPQHLATAGEADAVDLIGNLLQVFHLFEAEEHGVVLHQLSGVEQAAGRSGLFAAQDGVGQQVNTNGKYRKNLDTAVLFVFPKVG